MQNSYGFLPVRAYVYWQYSLAYFILTQYWYAYKEVHTLARKKFPRQTRFHKLCTRFWTTCSRLNGLIRAD